MKISDDIFVVLLEADATNSLCPRDKKLGVICGYVKSILCTTLLDYAFIDGDISDGDIIDGDIIYIIIHTGDWCIQSLWLI